MTMESRQPEGAGPNNDLVRSAALSSADLWHEILERLNEVQEGQLRLARAIESLGMIVCDALSVNPQSALSGGDTTSLPRTPQRVSLGAGPAPVDATDPRNVATTQRTIDSLLGADVFAPAPPAPAPTSAGERTADAPAVAASGSVTSPRFYVAPVPEENRTATREPVSSGSWPRGRRVARGLAREAPSMSAPAVVPNLTPAAIDALLAAEFGDAPAGPGPRVVPAAEGGALLSTLLGSEFGPAASPPVPPTGRLNLSAGGPPAVPPATRPPAPTVTAAPASMPTPARPPQAPSMPTPVAASARPPVSPHSPGWSPTIDPRRQVGAPSSSATPPIPPTPPTAAPRPVPGASPAPLLPPPVASPATGPGMGTSVGPRPSVSPSPPVAPSPGGVNLGGGPNPPGGPSAAPQAPQPPVPPPLRRAPLGAVTSNPAPFVAPGPPATDTTPTDNEGTSSPTKRTDSAASMATEILSASPNAPVVEPTEDKPTMMAEDVTIMAKGRRRRFRLR
jgi:eukaryotic-like serine/threonine-protein kinase